MTDISLNLLVGARHATSAALAYLHRGFTFERVFATEDDQRVVAAPTEMSYADRAFVQLCGGGAEFEYWSSVRGHEDQIRETVESWTWLLDLHTPGEYGWDSPEALAGGNLSTAFATGVAFYRSNRHLIEDVAQTLLERGGGLTHDEFIDVLDGREITPASVDTEWEITTALMPYTDSIREVEAHLVELRALGDD